MGILRGWCVPLKFAFTDTLPGARWGSHSKGVEQKPYQKPETYLILSLEHSFMYNDVSHNK